MTVEEVKNDKASMDRTLQTIVADFERITGLQVRKVTIDHTIAENASGRPVPIVGTEVHL
jgi:hypothetical protein